jgi:hypothetical protein
VIGWLTINPFVRILSWHHLDRSVRYNSWIPRLIGAVEQIIFTTSYLSGHNELIGIWLLMETAGEWGTQDREANPKTRMNDYSIFLIGTALSLMLSIGTAVFIQQILPTFPLTQRQ